MLWAVLLVSALCRGPASRHSWTQNGAGRSGAAAGHFATQPSLPAKHWLISIFFHQKGRERIGTSYTDSVLLEEYLRFLPAKAATTDALYGVSKGPS